MDEEKEMQGAVRSVALSITGEFLFFIGTIFALLGISKFVTEFLGVEGAGEFLVGIFLVIISFVLIMRSGGRKIKREPKEKEEAAYSEDYR